MDGYDESRKLYSDTLRGDEDAAVAFLAARAGGGPVLELGIGAGRIALPLAARGVCVEGLDISAPTVEQMRAKPGGEKIPVMLADFTEVPVAGAFRLIYVVWNTFFNLSSQDAQVRCFEQVAAHLTPVGMFVIEAYTPSFLHRLRSDQYVDAESIKLDEVCLDVLRHDAAAQRLEENHVRLTQSGITFAPVVQRYAWPSELDLMARLAGLKLKERWGGWGREPFVSDSKLHVSVYSK
ncbi:MAG: class I SAM-dependent methyltransferase [Planctomycetota bacterium]|nr:class I SAM-dependent methyltransferase [Planctomycetota bacterium]